MARVSGGHLVARYLRRVEGCEVAFGISGGHLEQLLDGLAEVGIRTIDVRHEQAAAMMAHAWALYTRRPGVCVVTAGPGFTNALTGIANAYCDHAPVLLLGGRSPLRDDLVGALQDIDQLDLVKPVVKWAAVCRDARRVPEYLATAYRHAVSGRPGPVYLELPPEVLGVSVPEESAPMPAAPARRFAARPAAADLAAAARLLDSARRPLLVGGTGLGLSDGAEAALGAFVETTGVPFVLLNGGRGTLPDGHPLCVWDVGLVGLMAALGQADLVIVAGTRLNWQLQHGRGIAPDARIVRIDVDAPELDRNRPATVGLLGDAALALAELTPLVRRRDHGDWIATLRAAGRALGHSEVDLRSRASAPIHPIRLVDRIARTIGEDAYYVVDGGDTGYFGLVGLRSRHRAGVLGASSGLLGCLGTGIPFAIAAKLAHPEKPAVVLTGDGSFGFNAMELDTAVRHGLPIVCVINDDQGWGMIRHAQELALGPGRRRCTDLGERHYERMVEGLGGHGELVTRDEQLVPALERARASGKPACVNVMTDPKVTSPATVLFYEGLKME